MRITNILIIITLACFKLSSQINYSLSKNAKDHYEIDVPKDTITKYKVKSVKGVLYHRKYNTDAFEKEMTICEKKYDTTGNAVYEKLSRFCVDGYCSQIYKNTYLNGKLVEKRECYSDGDFRQNIKYYYKANDTVVISYSQYK